MEAKKTENAVRKEEDGQAENEKFNYTSIPSDGPVSQSEFGNNADLDETENEEDIAENSNDIASNASGNQYEDD